MEQRQAELAVHELLLEGLGSLDGLSGQAWADRVEYLGESLVSLDTAVDRTLADVARACAVIQQLLLDLVPTPPSGPSRPAIVHCARQLLYDLHSDVTGAPPSLEQAPNVHAI